MIQVSFPFPKSARLLTKRDFARIRVDSKKFIRHSLVIRYRQGISQSPRLGIIVTKKYGKAHDRNAFKRWCREAFRLLSASMPPSIEITLSPRIDKQSLSFASIYADLKAFASYDHTQHSTSKSC